MKHETFLPNEAALLALAGSISRAWQSTEHGLVIWLQGDLGAGKTCFARGFLRGLGYAGVVKSPTYTLVEPYEPLPGRMCYHFDLYRLAEAEELEFTGARDYFDADAVCLVEWPEKATACLPAPDIVCSLVLQNKGRQVTLNTDNDRGKTIMLQLLNDDLL